MLKIQWWALRTCLPNTCVARNRFTGRRASRGVQLGVSIYPSRLSLYISSYVDLNPQKSESRNRKLLGQTFVHLQMFAFL